MLTIPVLLLEYAVPHISPLNDWAEHKLIAGISLSNTFPLLRFCEFLSLFYHGTWEQFTAFDLKLEAIHCSIVFV